MAKTTANEKTTAVATTQTTEIATNATLDVSEAMQALAQMRVGDMEQIAGNVFWSPDLDTTQPVIMAELTEVPKYKGNEGETVPAVRVILQNEQEVVCTDVVMVSTARKMIEKGRNLPLACIVECKAEMRKGQHGEYRDLNIWTLKA